MIPNYRSKHVGTLALALARAFGFLYEYEVLALQVLVQTLPERARCANVGAGSGTSSLAIVEARPDLFVWTVDISPGGPYGGLENERNAFRDTGLPLPRQVLGDSHVIGRNWPSGQDVGGPLDYVFIDADHSEKGIRGDIEAWRPNVKPGGLMVFHDYDSHNWPDVARVVDELMADCIEILTVDTLKAVRLP